MPCVPELNLKLHLDGSLQRRHDYNYEYRLGDEKIQLPASVIITVVDVASPTDDSLHISVKGKKRPDLESSEILRVVYLQRLSMLVV